MRDRRRGTCRPFGDAAFRYHSSGDVYIAAPAEGLERAQAPAAPVTAAKGTPYHAGRSECAW